MKIENVKGKQVNIIKKMENSTIHMNDNNNGRKGNSMWVYLLSFVVVIGAVLGSIYLIDIRGLPVPIVLPLVIIGVIMIFSVIGAFQLRNDDKLSQKNFLELMKLAFLKLPIINMFTSDNNKS